MNRKHILLADNDEDFLEARAELLGFAGYQVTKAATPKAASRILQNGQVDLAILDIRLQDDDDEKDTSGLSVVKEAKSSVPTIFLTAYPTLETVRYALGPIFGGPLAIGYVWKQEGPERLLEAIKSALAVRPRRAVFFGSNSGVDDGLIYQFDPPQSLFGWARQVLESELEMGDVDLELAARDLDTLMRRIFYGYGEITIEKIIPRPNGEVLARVKSSTRAPIILRCTTGGKAEEEVAAHQAADIPWSLTPYPWDSEGRVGMIRYAVLGVGATSIEWFPDYYDAHTGEEVGEVLDDLGNKLAWSLHKRECDPERRRSLGEYYRERFGFTAGLIARKTFDSVVSDLIDQAHTRYLIDIKRSPESGQLLFRLPRRQIIKGQEPATYIYQDTPRLQPFYLQRYSLGIRDDYSLAIDQDKAAWLLDTTRVGPAPTVSDYVALEALVRFGWHGSRDLAVLGTFEEVLSVRDPLRQRLPQKDLGSPDLNKAIGMISHLRRQAACIPGARSHEYQVGLLYHAAHLVINGSSPEQQIQALMAAALVSKSLAKSEEPI